MRRMLLGIYLALLGCAALLLVFIFGMWMLPVAFVLFAVSLYFTVDGWFLSGPRAREEGEDGPNIPPSYK